MQKTWVKEEQQFIHFTLIKHERKKVKCLILGNIMVLFHYYWNKLFKIFKGKTHKKIVDVSYIK